MLIILKRLRSRREFWDDNMISSGSKSATSTFAIIPYLISFLISVVYLKSADFGVTVIYSSSGKKILDIEETTED